jgi:hypothetical protein
MSPTPKPTPRGIPVLLMRCGMESPDCEAKQGFVLSLDKVTFGVDLLTAARKGGMKVVLPKMDGPTNLFRSLPMDDFLPNRPQLVAIVCGACAQAARDAKMLDGEIM